MTPSIIILSLLSSLFLFYLGLPWFALVPLIISMYIIFTNGDLHKKNTERQFSRYHILFGLRCTIVTGLSLLLHVF
ncbi:hypothetical protein KA478_04420 [Patescibacteria group bacterium]|nr:hypothetical protein [Patescibacteria group bacterium]